MVNSKFVHLFALPGIAQSYYNAVPRVNQINKKPMFTAG